MSSDDFGLLEPMLEPLTLKTRQVLEPANKPIKYNYFITSGLGSVIAIGKNGHRLEVGIIGREGMTGLPVVLGNDRSPNETFIQVEGTGSRIAADDLRQAMRTSASLTRLLLNFVNAFLIQTSRTALSYARRATRPLAAYGAGSSWRGQSTAYPRVLVAHAWCAASRGYWSPQSTRPQGDHSLMPRTHRDNRPGRPDQFG
jgi:CRP-like cAMP-binding protein